MLHLPLSNSQDIQAAIAGMRIVTLHVLDD